MYRFCVPQVALYGFGRLMLPRPTLRGVWMGMLLLLCAARIILPIIWAEGVVAVFFPSFASKPLERTKAVQRGAARAVVGTSPLKAS